LAVRELARRGEFDPQSSFSLDYRDARGGEHHHVRFIPAIQDEFLLHRPLAILNTSVARIAADVAAVAAERLKGEQVEIVRFDVAPGGFDPHAQMERLSRQPEGGG
jgi:hypothetical protein